MQGLAKTAGEVGHIEIIELEDPHPGPDEVLTQVDYAGLCGSDIGIYKYKEGFSIMDFPNVIGHEYSGTVIETGDQITRFEPGDHVVEQPIRYCEECYYCQSGSPNLCKNKSITGVTHDGAFAGYILAPQSALHHVPDGLDQMQAATTEPTSVAVRAVLENSRVNAGDKVLVQGPGPIGLFTAQVADAQGSDVFVSGIGQDTKRRLPVAEELGLSTINVEERDVTDINDERVRELGYDVVFDTTGHPSGIDTAAEAVCNGGQIVYIGLGDPTGVDFPTLLRKEVDLQCSFAQEWADVERALELIMDGTVDADPMIETQFSLYDGEESFEAAIDAEVCKTIFDVSELRD